MSIFRIFKERLACQRCNICSALSGWCIWDKIALIRLCCCRQSTRERLPDFREIPSQEGNFSFCIWNLESLIAKIIRTSFPSGTAVGLVVHAPCCYVDTLRGDSRAGNSFFCQKVLDSTLFAGIRLSKVKLENNNIKNSTQGLQKTFAERFVLFSFPDITHES